MDKWPGVNQMAARMAQPMEGKALRKGWIKPLMMPSSKGQARAINARVAPITRAKITEPITRSVEARV